MKSRMVKRILATLLAVVFLAGDVLPTVASDVEGTPQIIKEAEEEESSLWEDVVPESENNNEEAEPETPATQKEDETEVPAEEGELTEIPEGEAPLADGLEDEDELDEDAEAEEGEELAEGEEVAEEAEEDDYIILEHPPVDGVTVTVKAAAGVLPENTYVEVIELDDPVEVEEIISTITELENGETEENEEVVVTRYKAFDITLYVDDEDGNKTVVEPADSEKVTVSFAGDMIVPNGEEEVAIYHVDDNNASNVEKMEEVAVTTDENDEQVVELETDHFSKYVVALTATNKLKNDWSQVSGELKFKVVDENNNPIPNCWFVLKKNNSSVSTSSYPAKDTIFETDSQGIITLEIKEASSNNAAKTHVLKQLSSDGSHQRISDTIKITETTSRVKISNNNYTLTRTFTVEIKDGDSQEYTGNPIIVKNPTKTTSSNNDDPGRLDSVSKTAELVDWSNRVYKLDLNAVIGRTKTNIVSKVVIVTDASGSMTYVDVNPLNLKTDRVYFSNSLSNYGKWTSMNSNAKARLPEYRRSSYNGNDGGTYALAPTSGNYYFYDTSQGAWFTRDVSGLQNSNCYDWTKATRVSDISSVTLYTDRGEVLIDSLKEFVAGLPDGTKVEFIKFGDEDQFNNGYVDVSGGFKTVGTDDVAIQGYIEKMNPVGFTGTYPEYALKRTLDNYFKWYEDNTDCNLVFFADGASDGDTSKEIWYSNLIKASGVDAYSVGLKTKDGVLERVASSSDKIYTCNESESLAQAMQGISSEVSSKTHGVLIDEIDPHFEICTATGSTDSADVNSAYPGASISENSITWNDAEFTVGGTTHQYVYVRAKDDFAGGNVVTTNGTLTVSLNGVTQTAASPLVNVKGVVDANDQEDVIKIGESLKKSIEKHINALAPAEGEKDLRFTTSVADEDYASIDIKFFKDETYTGEYYTLEEMKELKPVKETKYYVLVEAVPNQTGASAQAQTGAAMTQDEIYYFMDRTLENNEREAVAKAEYVVKVEDADLEIKATKDAELIDWDARTYKVTLGAETQKKVTHYDTHTSTETAKVIFVLDTSSSMNGTKLSDLKTAANGLIAELAKNSAEIAAFSFNARNNAKTVISGYKKLSTKDNSVSEAQTAINGMTTSYGTYAAYGLDKALGILNNGENKNTFLIFFTDGSLNDEANAKTKAKSIRDKGVTMYGVTLGGTTKDAVIAEMTGNTVYHADSSSDLAGKFTAIGEVIEEATGTTLEPVAASNITIYDEISEYFDITDSTGKVLTDAEIESMYGATVGTSGELKTVTFTGLSSVLNSDNTSASVAKEIYLKAKPEFAGGNLVPTNGDYKVSVPDPKNPTTFKEDEIKEESSPTVNVKFEADGGEAFEEIFLGEKLASYWTDARKEEIKNLLYDDTPYTNYDFMELSTEIEWFYDKDCTRAVPNMLEEAPLEETVYYGRRTVEPTYPLETEEMHVVTEYVVGKYTVTQVTGKITVTKTINVTEDEKKLKYDGQPIFTFNLKKDGQVVQTKVIYFDDFATGTKSVTFDKLGKGTYKVEELKTAGWELTSSDGDKSVLISSRNDTGNFSFTNKPVKQKAFADKDVVVNSITKNEDGTISFKQKKGSN